MAGGQTLRGGEFVVPGDISSAAFWVAAAAAIPGSDVEIHNVGLNPTRIALLDVLRRGGAVVDEHVEREAGGEPSGRVRVRYGPPRSLTLGADQVPYLIDEIPALAAWASHGGELHVTGAGELRVKESDRISALVRGFQALGADVEEFSDGFHLRGSRRLQRRAGRCGGRSPARHGVCDCGARRGLAFDHQRCRLGRDLLSRVLLNAGIALRRVIHS